MRDPICGMNVNPKTSLSLKQGEEVYYFCSEHCLKKFAQGNKISLPSVSAPCCSVGRQWWQNKTFVVGLSLLFVMGLSYVFSFLEPFRLSFLMYLKTIWWAVLLGLFFGGIIDHFVPREYISYVLARPRKRTIFYSVFLGFLMSACSHGIIALTIELHKKGASTPAAIAFLLASPWANLPLSFMFIGFFGLTKALYIILCAIVIAITTGFIYQMLEKKDLIEGNKNSLILGDDFSLLEDVRLRFSHYRFSLKQATTDIQGTWQGAVALSNMVLWWLLVGMAIASLAGAYVSPHLFHKYMGPTVLGMIVTLGLATVLEVCSEGTAPLAFEIFRQTGALGNSFVFLMAGVVTDYTEIGLVWQNIGKKAAMWLPLITVPQVIFWGIVANWVF